LVAAATFRANNMILSLGVLCDLSVTSVRSLRPMEAK